MSASVRPDFYTVPMELNGINEVFFYNSLQATDFMRRKVYEQLVTG